MRRYRITIELRRTILLMSRLQDHVEVKYPQKCWRLVGQCYNPVTIQLYLKLTFTFFKSLDFVKIKERLPKEIAVWLSSEPQIHL